jgi:hypothetical protein
MKSKVKSMLIIFFDIKGIVHKEGQTVNSAYYCDVLWWLRENVRRLRAELWRQTNWLLYHDNPPLITLPSSPGNFLPKATRLSSPTHPTFLCLSEKPPF